MCGASAMSFLEIFIVLTIGVFELFLRCARRIQRSPGAATTDNRRSLENDQPATSGDSITRSTANDGFEGIELN